MKTGGADAADVHARTLPDGLEPLEYLDILRGIFGRHPYFSLPNGSGAGGASWMISVNEPREITSRPLPPRPVFEKRAVLMRCSPPRLDFTTSVSRSSWPPSCRGAGRRPELHEEDALAGRREVL